MKFIKDKIFIDTNILIYVASKGDYKCEIARKLLVDNADLIVISSQVINEFINISIKKSILLPEKAYNYALNFMEIFDFIPIDKREIEKAIFIKAEV